MKDKVLSYIWSKQKEFNRNFVDFDNLTDSQRQFLTKEYVLHLIDETSSLLNEVNWKIHHKSDSIKINRQELILEWIDMFKYWLSIGLIWGISPEEMLKAFEEKSALVEQRYLQEYSDLGASSKGIVVVDIDGVLSDYPKTFLQFVDRNEERTKLSSQEITSLDLYKLFEGQISTEKLKEYKHQYRSEGLSRSEKVEPGAVEFLKSLKDSGYYVVLLTSRPFDKYRNLYLDTYMWLKLNGLEFDMLLNDSKKRDKIIKLVSSSSSRVKFLVDDDLRIVNGLLGLDGLDKIYLIDKPYNQQVDPEKIHRVKNLAEIVEEESL